jgi:peptide/nickel transport system substrate-binding protein
MQQLREHLDRQAIASVTQRGLADSPSALNNHIYLAGQEGYQDNSIGYDLDAAAAELEALGWTINGDNQFREKDGRQLKIRDVFYDGASTRAVAQSRRPAGPDRGEPGAIPAAAGICSPSTTSPGNFDITQFSWVGDAFLRPA